MNFLKEACEKRDNSFTVQSTFITGVLQIDTNKIDKEVTIGIRPEHVTMSEAPSENSVDATVKNKTLSIGGQYLFTLQIGEQTLKAKADNIFGSKHHGKRAWIELFLKYLVVFNSSENRVHGKIAHLSMQ